MSWLIWWVASAGAVAAGSIGAPPTPPPAVSMAILLGGDTLILGGDTLTLK